MPVPTPRHAVALQEEVAAMEAAMAVPGYVPNTAQRRLAEEVTRFVHGEEGLAQALKATEVRAAMV
jgi:tyrosyl-tRNA synthetase